MQVLRFFWWFWCLIVAFHSLLIVTPLYFLILLFGGRKAERTAHKISYLWAWYLLTLIAVRLKVRGGEKLDSAKTYVIVGNHASQLDIPVAAASTNVFFKFLAKEELTKIPLLGFIIRRLYLTVSRGSARDRVRSLQKMKEAIKAGTSVLIFPEGTRNKTDALLLPLQEGAFKLAADTGIPIAILIIKGTGRLSPPGKTPAMQPGRVEAIWEGPIQGNDLQVLKEEARLLMLKHLR